MLIVLTINMINYNRIFGYRHHGTTGFYLTGLYLNKIWHVRPQGDSNPCYRRERAMS